MRIVTLGRKPCRGGATANVVAYEAGAFNIEGTRIGVFSEPSQNPHKATGRWPANVFLEHPSGCRVVGTKIVEGYSINRFTDGAKPFGNGAGHEFETEKFPNEIVDLWKCVEGCPLSNLRGIEACYFKHLQRKNMSKIPQELWDYLYTLIAPPSSCDPILIVETNLDHVSWDQYEDTSVHGLITVGDPSAHLEEIDRVLRPGAHVLLLSPEEDPTGYVGACAIEDFGYEIRDAIAILDRPDEFHYVAKPSPNERHAGVPEQKDECTGRFVQNSHVTVKPVGVMQGLLKGIPMDQGPVVDPFVGSGTTGIACLHTKHDFIGIEQDASYLVIADQRIRHWDRAICAWNGAEIQSEAVIEEEDEPVGIADFFGV